MISYCYHVPIHKDATKRLMYTFLVNYIKKDDNFLQSIGGTRFLKIFKGA